MTRFPRLEPLLGSMVVAVFLAGAAALAQGAFRGRVDLVRLPVVVTGEDGTPVTDLGADDFEVLEGDERQTIVSFAAGSPGETVPLHLGLMIDKSESMELDLEDAAKAAVSFVETLDEVRDVTLVEFDARVRIGRFAPANYLRLFERIRDPTLGARTVLYDAIAHYLDTTLTRHGQHVLVIYTDGGDSGSSLNISEVMHLLRFGNVVLYAIGYLEHQTSSAQIRQRALLSALARDTGGEAYFPASAAAVAAIYEKIRLEIQGRYTLGYIPAEAAVEGSFRSVEVRIRAPEPRDLQVRTRAGYIAGASQ